MDETLYNSQKISNDLNLSLGIPTSDRLKSEELTTGYNPQTRFWELIVKYNGDISEEIKKLGGFATRLFGGYAIITIPEENIPAMAQLIQVEYIEKPTRLFYEAHNNFY